MRSTTDSLIQLALLAKIASEVYNRVVKPLEEQMAIQRQYRVSAENATHIWEQLYFEGERR